MGFLEGFVDGFCNEFVAKLTRFECEECGFVFEKELLSKEKICEDCKTKIENEKNEKRILIIRKNISKPKILFIYDTSWLMCPNEYNFKYGEDYNIKHIILNGVKKEIRGHINNSEEKKRIDAGIARRKVSEIMMYNGYEDYDENMIPEYCPLEKILGPDSKVDKQCLSLANKEASTFKGAIKTNMIFAFILTHDGGIKAEASNLFVKYHKLVFTYSSIKKFNELLETIESQINEKVTNLSLSN